MVQYISIKESKEIILQITQEIFPSANLKRSSNLLKSFRDLHYSSLTTKEIAHKVMMQPKEFQNFCKRLILKENKLSEDDFNHLLNQVCKLNLEQLELLSNKILLSKSNILHLISKQASSGE